MFYGRFPTENGLKLRLCQNIPIRVMPLANVIGKGGIANNDAAAIVPPAIATGAAASAKVSINPSKRQSLV